MNLSSNNNVLTADINIGGGWWRFIYEKTQPVVVANPNITFRVDMSDYTSPINNGVYLNGNFNNWCGACAPMTNIGNNIYELTVALPVGPIEYLFTVDEWSDLEVFESTANCIDPTVDDFNNRYFEVAEDAVLPTVCFNSCEACPGTAGVVDHNSVDVDIYPNPAENQLCITTDQMIEVIELLDMNGEFIQSCKVNNNVTFLNVADLSSGLYLLNLTINGEISRRLIYKN